MEKGKEEKKPVKKRRSRVMTKESGMAGRYRRKTLIHQLDSVFSLYIRLKTAREFKSDLCPFCRKKPIDECFHFITRSKYSIRWDERNAIGSCRGCNLRNEYDPHDFIQFYLKHNGAKAYEELIKDGHGLSKFSRSDLAEMLDDLKSKLENIKIVSGQAKTPSGLNP